MAYTDIRALPLPYRRWFIDRLSEEFKKKAEAQKKSRQPNVRELPMGEVADMIDNAKTSTVKSFKS